MKHLKENTVLTLLAVIEALYKHNESGEYLDIYNELKKYSLEVSTIEERRARGAVGTFEELFKVLWEEKKIRKENWRTGDWIKFQDTENDDGDTVRRLIDESDSEYSAETLYSDWNDGDLFYVVD